MLARIKNWDKKFNYLIFFCAFCICQADAQPITLQPQWDNANGLPGNSVRTVCTDAYGRIWIGSENGLMVFNANTPSEKKIIKAVATYSIWGVSFFHNSLIIATKFNGLFVFDPKSGKQEAHFDSSIVNECRRLRVLSNQCFVLAKTGAYRLEYTPRKKWKLIKLTSDLKDGFFTDVFKWKGQIYATHYQEPTLLWNKGYILKNDTLVAEGKLVLYNRKSLINASYFAAVSDSERIFAAGVETHSYLLNEKKYKINYTGVRDPVIWDAIFIKNRIYAAAGRPVWMNMGAVLDYPHALQDPLRNNMFAQSLFYDSAHKGLWIGTYNRGVFFWPDPANSIFIPEGKSAEYNFSPVTSSSFFYFDNWKVIYADIEKNTRKIILKLPEGNSENIITSVKKYGDTTIVLTTSSVILLNSNFRTIKSFSVPGQTGREFHKYGNNLFFPSLHENFIIKLNIKDGRKLKIDIPTTEMRAVHDGDGLFYYAEGTGFGYIDSTCHTIKGFYPRVESFTLLHDKVWILNGSKLTAWHFDKKTFSLKKVKEVNAGEMIPNWRPSDIVSTNNKLLLVYKNAVLKLHEETVNPEWVYYTGNYLSHGKPIPSDSSVLFNRMNYLCRVIPENLVNEYQSKHLEVQIPQAAIIYQNSPFTFQFKHPDPIIQNYLLKKIELIDKHQHKTTFYCFDSTLYLHNGLRSGKYKMRFWVNNILAGERELIVRIPLLNNPDFYLTTAILFVLLSFLFIKSSADKRALRKRLLENKFQLLKQNLNPHFIFNTLNLIYALVLENKRDTSAEAIIKFSELHRYYLENINEDIIPLEKELDFTLKYISLEQLRVAIDSPFTVHEHIPDKLRISKMLVPCLILQPLVENAIKYSIATSSEILPPEIWIELLFENNQLLIAIENTFDAEKLHNIHGSGNGQQIVKERIMACCELYQMNVEIKLQVPLQFSKVGYRVEIILTV